MISYREWVELKIQLAQELGLGALGASYAEGAIILCATISAMSSQLWHSSKWTDRKRFTEVVTRFPPDGRDPTRVSAPLLVEKFPELTKGFKISEKSLYLTENDDKREVEVISIFKAANLPYCKKSIRKYSYANLLYEQVRCGFVHEYQAGGNATDKDALKPSFGTGSNHISYANIMAEDNSSKVKRRIHIPLEWICDVARTVASGTDCERARHNKSIFKNLGLTIPCLWWIEGG